MLTLDKVYHAAYVLKEVVRRTDLIPANHLHPNSEVYLKPENLQVTGSFKVRGAYYKMSVLSEKEERARGVIACSAGNHAQVWLWLRSANIFMPPSVCPTALPFPKWKPRNVTERRSFVPGVYDDAYQKALQLRDEKGYTFIHPFNDEDVIAGQASIGLELLNQLEDVEAVIVPVGGGGLISGVAFAIKSLRPSCKVYGVQAAGAASMFR